MPSSLQSCLGWLYEDKAVVVLESSTTFLLLKRSGGKRDWWDDDVQIRLEAEVRRLQENPAGRVTTNSPSAQTTAPSQTRRVGSVSNVFISPAFSRLPHRLSCWAAPCRTPLSARPRESRRHRGVRSSLGHLPRGSEFQSKRHPGWLPSPSRWVVLA